MAVNGFKGIPSELTCTSLPQQWSVPRGDKIEAEAVSNLKVIKPKEIRKRKITDNTLTDNRKIRVTDSDLQHLRFLTISLPISYLISTPKKTANTHLGTTNIGSGLYTHASFYEPYTNPQVGTDCGELAFPHDMPGVHLPDSYATQVTDDMKITFEKSKEIEEKTRDQSDSVRWHEERKYRLTASRFHEVSKRKNFSDKYLEQPVNPKQINVSATSYGRHSEKKVRQSYIKEKGNHVHDCGLVVNPAFPFIAASPDGKVCENGECGILEIKCPFSARDMHISETTNLNNFCLDVTENGKMLKKNHQYFYQIQGQLSVTAAPFCDFVVCKEISTHRKNISR